MNANLKSELVEESSARASFYALLSSFYLVELTSQQIENFKGQDFDLLKGADPLIDDGLVCIQKYFGLAAGKDMREELACDFAHSILGATADERTMATPYESVFTSEHGLVMQESRDDVYRLFCQEHLGTPEGKDIPEDHLGLIFEFMSHMCLRFAEALNAGQDCEAFRISLVQQEMVTNHLANWIDAYCDTLEDVCRTQFYRGIAKMTRGWVKLELDIANELVSTMTVACAE